MAWFCTHPLYILERPRSPCQPPKVRFCTVMYSPCAVWGPQTRKCYEYKIIGNTCNGRGPLLESCRHKVHKTGNAILYTYRVLQMRCLKPKYPVQNVYDQHLRTKKRAKICTKCLQKCTKCLLKSPSFGTSNFKEDVLFPKNWHMFIIVILYKLINIAMLAGSVPEGPSCIALGVIAGFGRNLLGDPCIWWDIGIRHGHGPLWLRGNWAKIQKSREASWRNLEIQTLDFSWLKASDFRRSVTCVCSMYMCHTRPSVSDFTEIQSGTSKTGLGKLSFKMSNSAFQGDIATSQKSVSYI
jgi:hypothetical protein